MPVQPPAIHPHTTPRHTGALITPGQHTRLEALRSRWQSAAEALCSHQGLNPSLLGVVVSEVLGHTDASGPAAVEQLPAGVQHFRQVQDWVVTTAAQAHRLV